MKLTKQEFVKAIQNYQAHIQRINQLSQITKTNVHESPLFDIANDYYDLLRIACDIPCDTKLHDLDFFVYELDFGARYYPGCYVDSQGNEISLKTPEDLYNALCATWGEYHPRQ